MTKPFRIALIVQGGHGWMGGMEYIRNIILALARLSQDVRNSFEISLLTSTSTDRNFVESIKPYLKKVYVVEELVRPTILNRVKWAFTRQILRRHVFLYDTIIKDKNFDFIYPYTSCYGGFSPKKVAAWIYDFQHKYLPDYFTQEEIRERDKEFSQMILQSPIVVLSSETAEADCKKFYPEAALKTKVLPFTIIPHPHWYDADPLEIQHKYNLPDKFFIISNQFWRHKNHLIVFEALKLLNVENIKPAVICTGHAHDYRNPHYFDSLLQTIHKLGLARQVYVLGLIPKIDQIQLLRRSIALIQPSLFEGWSTVVEDARCMGKPSILSDFPVHMEQNPPNCRFFKRTSPESLASVMADYWQLLSPGPVAELELIARETNRTEVQEFAAKFLKIATTVNESC